MEVYAGLHQEGQWLMNNNTIRLNIDTEKTGEHLDLRRYSLSHGGISPHPEFSEHVAHLQQLKPNVIRFFLMDYYGTFPAKGQYDWAKVDNVFEAIIATGAHPFPCICYKPKSLFPVLDEKVVHPVSYPEWEELIGELVKHCKEKEFGVEYWEIGNEGDFGEQGGCPYLFTPENYPIYYTHTVQAILRADPAAKVGGPALADYRGPMADSLIEHCGKGGAPLDFFTWHMYSDSAESFRESIRVIKSKLRQYPALKATQTMITEWNMDFLRPNMNPWFPPCHLLETTKAFVDEGLDLSAYYQIRDSYYEPGDFAGITSTKWNGAIDGYFNTMSYLGLYDNQGRVRPSYFVFKGMSRLVGDRLCVEGVTADVKSLAVKDTSGVKALFWNFPAKGSGTTYDCSLDISSIKEGLFRFMRINAEAPLNNIEYVRSGSIEDLKRNPLSFTLSPYEIKWLEIVVMETAVNPNFGAPEVSAPSAPH